MGYEYVSEEKAENRLHIRHVYATDHSRDGDESHAGKRCPDHSDGNDIPRRFAVTQKEGIITCTFSTRNPGNQQQYAKINGNYRKDDIAVH